MLLLTTIITSLLMIGYLWVVREEKFTTKKIVIIGMFSAMSFVLYLIQFIKYPQGGGISLFSMLPTLVLAVLYGYRLGLTAGLIFGLLKCLNGAVIVHPVQFVLDYLLANMALGLAGIGKKNNRVSLFLSAFLATMLGVFFLIVSGGVFFAEYAPAGMNIWWYSLLYNMSSAGIESLLTAIIFTFIPLKRLEKILNLSKNS